MDWGIRPKIAATLHGCLGNGYSLLDPGLRRIYAACFSGVIAVYQEDDAEQFRKIEDFPVQKMVTALPWMLPVIAFTLRSHAFSSLQHQPDGCAYATVIHDGGRSSGGTIGHRRHNRCGANGGWCRCSLFAGFLFAQPSLINFPFFIAGSLKIVYDFVLYREFLNVRPPEKIVQLG
jgi:hypothetical protein